MSAEGYDHIWGERNKKSKNRRRDKARDGEREANMLRKKRYQTNDKGGIIGCCE